MKYVLLDAVELLVKAVVPRRDFARLSRERPSDCPHRNGWGRTVFFWMVSAALLFAPPLLRPLGMTVRQAVSSGILLVCIFWWSTKKINRNLVSLLLLSGFWMISGAGVRTILTFPLSNTFLLLVLTYIFSRGIENSGLAEKFLEPILFRFADRPWKAMAAVAALFALTMYAIPQPLARLIIVAGIFRHFLEQTDCGKEARQILMFSVFAIYVFINCTTMKADMIVNTAIAAVAGVTFGDGGWIRYMAVPSLLYLVILIVLIQILFRRELTKGPFQMAGNVRGQRAEKRDWQQLIPLAFTVGLWMTESLHGIPAWAVTLGCILVMALQGNLKWKDLKAVDGTTLLFLTAAMSIGGVMRETGVADLVFRWMGAYFAETSLYGCIAVLLVITVGMHMVLGSNTTTLSVVTPGMLIMCGSILPKEIIMCVISVTLATQWLLPFHSVGMMIGVSKGYFESRLMTKTGLVLSVLLFGAIFFLYVPWWCLIGVL